MKTAHIPLCAVACPSIDPTQCHVKVLVAVATHTVTRQGPPEIRSESGRRTFTDCSTASTYSPAWNSLGRFNGRDRQGITARSPTLGSFRERRYPDPLPPIREKRVPCGRSTRSATPVAATHRKKVHGTGSQRFRDNSSLPASRRESTVSSQASAEVKILRWPTEARERERYRQLGVPRILVLEESVPAPRLDILEDCVRQPIASDDLLGRAEALRARALSTIPVVDSADVLRFGGTWLSLSPIDAGLVRLLVASFQSVVTRDKLIAAGWPRSPARRNALDLRILGLRRRIAPLDLRICTIWKKGYLLDRSRGT